MGSYRDRNTSGVASIELNPENPLDDLASVQMQTIARKGRGFVLDVFAGHKVKVERARELIASSAAVSGKEGIADGAITELDDVLAMLSTPSIEVREQPKLRDEYERPTDYRSHHLTDTDSFVAYARRYGTQGKSFVVLGEDKATLVIDEERGRGQREMIQMELEQTKDWKDWSEIVNGAAIGHLKLLDFLRRHEHNLLDPTILLSMASLKATAVVSHESELTDTGATLGMVVKTNGGEATVNFPKAFKIDLLVLQQDEDSVISPSPQVVEIKLNVNLPTDPMGKVSFNLVCSMWPNLLRKRIRQEANTVREALAGWTVVQGTPGYVKRVLPKGSRDED